MRSLTIYNVYLTLNKRFWLPEQDMRHKQWPVARVLVLVERYSQRDIPHTHHTQPTKYIGKYYYKSKSIYARNEMGFGFNLLVLYLLAIGRVPLLWLSRSGLCWWPSLRLCSVATRPLSLSIWIRIRYWLSRLRAAVSFRHFRPI